MSKKLIIMLGLSFLIAFPTWLDPLYSDDETFFVNYISLMAQAFLIPLFVFILSESYILKLFALVYCLQRIANIYNVWVNWNEGWYDAFVILVIQILLSLFAIIYYYTEYRKHKNVTSTT